MNLQGSIHGVVITTERGKVSVDVKFDYTFWEKASLELVNYLSKEIGITIDKELFNDPDQAFELISDDRKIKIYFHNAVHGFLYSVYINSDRRAFLLTGFSVENGDDEFVEEINDMMVRNRNLQELIDDMEYNFEKVKVKVRDDVFKFYVGILAKTIGKQGSDERVGRH